MLSKKLSLLFCFGNISLHASESPQKKRKITLSITEQVMIQKISRGWIPTDSGAELQTTLGSLLPQVLIYIINEYARHKECPNNRQLESPRLLLIKPAPPQEEQIIISRLKKKLKIDYIECL